VPVKPIYLDYNATTPIDPVVAEAMKPFLSEDFGNPSSGHYYGHRARAAVERARGQVASLLRCKSEEIIFTSGGTESNNHAIRGYAFANEHKGRHIITSQIEHPAVLEVCRYLEEHGFDITYLPVDSYGAVLVEDLEGAIRADTILVTIMLANNEVGTIQPIERIAAILNARGVRFHTDAAQAVGKIPVHVGELGVDMLSIAGHKLYAPKGIGALYLRGGLQLEKFMFGADHESNRRAGTENVLEIVGLGAACEVAEHGISEFTENMASTRDRLESLLTDAFPLAKVNGHPERRLPNTLSISFPNVEANTILSEATGIAVSAGAACHSDAIDVSHVLVAMGVPESTAMGTIRVSTGRSTTDNDIDAAFDEINRVVSNLMGSGGSVGQVETSKGYQLTRFTHGLGCACKLRPQVLESVLKKMPASNDPKVLVGTEYSDDAAVYLIDDDLAVVQSVDFFTPVVDDPYQFGQVAAANSLSDLYAMNADPLFALSVVGFPSNRLPQSVLEDILRGAHDKAAEAGISIIGGHTVDDTEPKYGLAVTGKANPEKLWMNKGARTGDKLILTKPLGTGILATAIKQGMADEDAVEKIFDVMSALNKIAMEVLRGFEIHACTDVTGFGLMGHLHEMSRASECNVRVDSESVPFIPGADDMAASGIVPGGTSANMDFVSPNVRWSDDVDNTNRILLCDAQTSGGLLAAISIPEADEALQRLKAAGVKSAAIIGEFTDGGDGTISVT